jgi:hypothetical protein
MISIIKKPTVPEPSVEDLAYEVILASILGDHHEWEQTPVAFINRKRNVSVWIATGTSFMGIAFDNIDVSPNECMPEHWRDRFREAINVRRMSSVVDRFRKA